jgi:hypothetical protein
MDDSPIAPACSAFAFPELFSLAQSLRRREGIATYCIAHGLQLLHADRNFDGLEKQLGLNAVGRETGERQILEKAGHADIENGTTKTRGLSSDGAGEPGFARSRLSGKDQIASSARKPNCSGHSSPPLA